MKPRDRQTGDGSDGANDAAPAAAPAGDASLAARSCPACGQPMDLLRARALSVVGGRVVAFCSRECKERGALVRVAEPILDEEKLTRAAQRGKRARRRQIAMAAGGLVLAGALLGVRVRIENRQAQALPLPAPVAALPPPVPVDDRPSFGPLAPPPAELVAERDTWFHPLAGPTRHLPERPTRRFGVERPHESPESCRMGHCGCDVGLVRGEPVFAVHDGVVDRVVTEDQKRGGRYVRLIHQNGAVITQYMHLESIATRLHAGVHVKAGDVIGTVGETGVVSSGPHLHFTVATRKSPDAPEVYIDPEPLLTLWPLHDPVDETTALAQLAAR